MRHAAGDRAPGLSGYDAELQLLDVALRRAIGAGPATTSSTSAVVPGGRPGTSHVRPGRGGRLGARDRARREPARAEGVRNATFPARRRADPPLSAGALRPGDEQVRHDVLRRPPWDLGRALRPAGRLVMTVWQAHERTRGTSPSADPSRRPRGRLPVLRTDRLADPPSVREILRAAVFSDIAFTDVREPVCYGPPPSTGSTASRAPARP